MADSQLEPVTAALHVDRSPPVGNSLGVDGRNALHVKVRNANSEPVPITIIATTDPQLVTGETKPFSASAVAVASETTIFTFTVPVSNGFAISGWNISGRANALFRIKVAGTAIDFGQIVWTQRTVNLIFQAGHKVAAGDTITVTVFNQGEASADFFGSVNGRLL